MKVAGLLKKCVSKTIKDEMKEQRTGFLSMLLGKLGATLLEHFLTGKRVKIRELKQPDTLVTQAIIPGQGVMREVEGRIAMNHRIRG